MMNLSVEGRLRLAARLAFVAGMSAAAQAAYAQEAAAAAPAVPTTDAKTGVVQLGTVQVTGSRLKQPNLTSSSSMQLINDKEFALQGTTNVESLINSLPQAFAEFSTGDSNGATGTATVNLRGLGSNRTLVLVDGKRLMPGDPLLGPQADLNFIPAPLVERVEILSGGASAIYGSDALTGVVNFIMKKDFDGFRLDSQLSQTDKGDGTIYDVMGVWGSNFAGGKGNVTVYSGYSKTNAITQAERKFSKCSITTPASGDKHNCAGSRVIAEGRILSYDRYYNADPAIAADYYSIVDPAGSRTLIPDDGRTFNFAPFNYLQRSDNRYTLGGFGHREINEHLDVFGSAMFMDDRSIAQIAPSGIFGQPASVPCSSPLLSAQQKQYLCTDNGLGDADSASIAVLKRTTEVGPRQADLRHTDYRILFGGRGEIIDGIDYEVTAQRGEVIYNQAYLNDVSLTRAANAFNVDAQGNCVNDQANGCIPLDIFQVGAITPAQANYVRGIGISTGSVVEQVISSSVNFDLGKFGAQSPWAKNGVGLALGYEYRTEALDFRPDFSFQTGDLAGQGGPTPPTKGDFQVNEIFGEINAPIWEDQPYAKLLSVDGAYRYANYSNSANDVQSYKMGLKFAPISDVLARISFSRATRAPSIQELTAPSGQGLFGGSDPCAGVNLGATVNGTFQYFADAPTLEQCMSTGVTQAQYENASIPDCNSGQCTGFFGGNPNLKAEVSTTRSFGLVLTPTFIKGFSATIDYFDISVDDAISAFPQSQVIKCLLTDDDDACGRITRAGNGRLSTAPAAQVSSISENTGTLRTKGIDVDASYRLRLKDVGLGAMGSVTTTYTATFLDEFSQGLPGFTFDCAGLYGINCGTPSPEYRHKVRVTWDTPYDLSVSLNWRYYGAVTLDKNERDNPLLRTGQFNAIDDKIEVKQYLDLSGLYTLPTKDKNLRLRFGVSNVAGQNPPTVSSGNPNPVSSPPFGNGNTFPNVYDSLGRVMFVGLTADF